MSKTSEEPESLVGQILQDMLRKLQDNTEFDEQVLQDLRRLAEDGGLKKAQRLTQVLKSTTEKQS
jgi:hypothetical protein